jgi:hypothetical protein
MFALANAVFRDKFCRRMKIKQRFTLKRNGFVMLGDQTKSIWKKDDTN